MFVSLGDIRVRVSYVRTRLCCHPDTLQLTSVTICLTPSLLQPCSLALLLVYSDLGNAPTITSYVARFMHPNLNDWPLSHLQYSLWDPCSVRKLFVARQRESIKFHMDVSVL
jgi:hypothetical protein